MLRNEVELSGNRRRSDLSYERRYRDTGRLRIKDDIALDIETGNNLIRRGVSAEREKRRVVGRAFADMRNIRNADGSAIGLIRDSQRDESGGWRERCDSNDCA